MTRNKTVWYRMTIVFAAITLGPLEGTSAAESDRPSACAASGGSAVPALVREWILVGWELKAGDQFKFRDKVGRFYEWGSKDVVLYDNFDPKLRITHSAADYGAIWDSMFPSLRSVRHRVLDGPFVVSSGNLAASTLQFAARIEGADGKITGIRTLSSLVWQCTDSGWKIVREHNSSALVPAEQIDDIVAPTGIEN